MHRPEAIGTRQSIVTEALLDRVDCGVEFAIGDGDGRIEQIRLHGRLQIRGTDAEQTQFRSRMRTQPFGKQALRSLGEYARLAGRRDNLHLSRLGDEVVATNFDRHATRIDFFGAQACSDLVGETGEFRRQGRRFRKVGGEGVFCAHRFVVPIRIDRTIVDPCGTSLPALPVGAEQRAQFTLARASQRAQGGDAGGHDLVALFASESGQSLYRQGIEDCMDAIFRHHRQPVGLLEIGGDLGDEFVGRDADGGRESRAFAYAALDLARDGDGVAFESAACRDVEIGFVERQTLHERRELVEHGEHLCRHFGITRHARAHADGMRTQLQRAADRHRRAHAEFAHLVTRSRDDAATARAADDQRQTDELGAVALFDRGVERVHVDVQNHFVRLPSMHMPKDPSILFVCSGNICRSPTAEGVFRALAMREAPWLRGTIDSAGMHDFHAGEPPDPRTIAAARRRGYDLSVLRARRIEPDDFDRFDLLLAMDEGHRDGLLALAPPGRAVRVSLYLSHWAEAPRSDVPDPYYGGPADFERVLDLVEGASRALIARLR